MGELNGHVALVSASSNQSASVGQDCGGHQAHQDGAHGQAEDAHPGAFGEEDAIALEAGILWLPFLALCGDEDLEVADGEVRDVGRVSGTQFRDLVVDAVLKSTVQTTACFVQQVVVSCTFLFELVLVSTLHHCIRDLAGVSCTSGQAEELVDESSKLCPNVACLNLRT